MAGQTVIFENRPSFAVPNEIADNYLKAPEDALRLILFLLRNSSQSFTRDDICGATGIENENLDAAFDYWVERGVLFRSQQKYMLTRPQLKTSDIHPYSAEEVASRIDRDGAIRFLYERTESLLSRPLSTSDAYTLLSIVDWMGLPPEVAALLLQYCSDTGKKSMRQIEKTAVMWADGGIDSFEKAEEFISAEKEKEESAMKTARLLGVANRALGEEEKKVFIAWRTELGYGDEMISAAYESMIKSIGSYKYQYIDKILHSWKASGINTPEEAATQKPTAKKPSRAKKYEPTAAPDAEKTVDKTWEIMKKAVSEDDE
ncbi:MAG: DnaD domain protein [Clostridia bacterium]|nr:DnaD domain protein [Clostridia bacterium]